MNSSSKIKNFPKIYIIAKRTRNKKKKYSLLSIVIRFIVLILIIISILIVNLLENNIIILSKNEVVIIASNKTSIFINNKANNITKGKIYIKTNNKTSILTGNKTIGKGFLFVNNKIDDNYLISLEKHIKNEKIYDINEFPL